MLTESEAKFNYVICIIIFSIIVIPLSLLDLSEQVTVQVSMAICRFVMLFLMVSTIAYSTFFNMQSFTDIIPNEGMFIEYNRARYVLTDLIGD